MKTARDCLSTRVVTVAPEQRLIDVTEKIVRHDALYCAVIGRGGAFIGLVRLKEIVTRSSSRIFSDLVPATVPQGIEETLPVTEVVQLLQSKKVDELLVLRNGEQYVGLITRESIFDWWAREAKAE